MILTCLQAQKFRDMLRVTSEMGGRLQITLPKNVDVWETPTGFICINESKPHEVLKECYNDIKQFSKAYGLTI